jgi:hypothetical protein
MHKYDSYARSGYYGFRNGHCSVYRDVWSQVRGGTDRSPGAGLLMRDLRDRGVHGLQSAGLRGLLVDDRGATGLRAVRPDPA